MLRPCFMTQQLFTLLAFCPVSCYNIVKACPIWVLFERIYEDNRSFPNDEDLESVYKIFNIDVDFI